MSKKRDISAALLGIVVALILWGTILGREAQDGDVLIFRPFHTFTSLWKDIRHGGIRGNFLGNILMFVPVGVLVPLLNGWRKWYKTVLIGFGLSIFIEITQLITKRGYFDPDDVILNVIGTLIGCVLLRAVVRKKEFDTFCA